MSCCKFRSFTIFLAVLGVISLFPAESEAASACVWKVTRSDGKVIYLGGSIHHLRKSDYPLPTAFTRAFEASSRIAFEVDADSLDKSSQLLVDEGQYKKGDSLKKHVDPRTYAYLRRLFDLIGIPEASYAQYKPWFIVLMLQSSATQHALPETGVDQFFMKRAAKRSMPIVGLESVREHARVYSGLTDRESEILLLTTFIPNGANVDEGDMVNAWRRGDADGLARLMEREGRQFPTFNERLLGARNRAWVSKIEGFLGSNSVYFVVVGAGHFGGKQGLLSLLRTKGYRIEQF